jgi:hypothetical protein
MPSWAEGNTANGATREREYPVEKKVSDHIRSMPFLWVEVEDDGAGEGVERRGG